MEKDLAFVITEKDGHEYKIYFDGRVSGFKGAHVINFALPVLIRLKTMAKRAKKVENPYLPEEYKN